MLTLRRVSKGANFTATEFLVEYLLKRAETRLEQLRRAISEKWDQNPSEQEGLRLTTLMNSLESHGEELKLIRKKVDEKRLARTALAREGSHLSPEAAQALLAPISFTPEFLLLRDLARALRSDADRIEHWREPNYDPLRARPPRRPQVYPPEHPYPDSPFAPYPFPRFPGEPDPDHFRVPDWERDRNPAGLPYNPDPFGPPGLGPRRGGPPSPFGPGPNPFQPRPPPGFGPRFL